MTRFSRFEWDEHKRRTNIEKHGLDFVRAAEIFDGPVLERTIVRNEEDRLIAIGVAADKLITVVYTLRGELGDVCRIISARRARQKEERDYRQLYP